MMKIFVTYKYEDMDEVQKRIEKFRALAPDVGVSILRQSRHWKRTAREHIAKADFVIYFAGKKYSDNIDWEIETALKSGRKIYCVKLYADAELEDDRLYRSDAFDVTKRTLKIEAPVSMVEMLNLVGGDNTSLHEKLFQNGVNDDAMLIEQYKLLLSTSESLIERRQKLTTTYVSVFSILLPVVSAMLSLPYYFLYAGAAVVSIICIVLCVSWRSTILSYGKSNRAKFAILEEIERKLPVAMFASEWFALKRFTTKFRSFTRRETVIPLTFAFVYAIFAVVSIVFLIVRV